MEKEKNVVKKSKFSADWLVKGILTRTGEAFDRITGRNWKPSSLATSELVGKIRQLLDLEVRDLGPKGKFAPHHIKLKMQWDKFSTDSEESIEKLKNELHAAVVDHINDRRYYTYGPLTLEITKDYFTDGVKLTAAFETFGQDEAELSVNLSSPDPVGDEAGPITGNDPETSKEVFVAIYSLNGMIHERRLSFSPGEGKSIGRSAQNDLVIDENSVTKKFHAKLVFDLQKRLMVVDTGSTNGTFLNGRRIPNGRTVVVAPSDILTFGSVEVEFKRLPPTVEAAENSLIPNEIAEAGNEQTDRMTTAPPAEAPGKMLQVDDYGQRSTPASGAGNSEESEESERTRQGSILGISDKQE